MRIQAIIPDGNLSKRLLRHLKYR